MPFHENLRTLRLARGLTQPALAEKADIEQSYLSKLENGRSRPSEEVLARLAQALEVKPEALANGDETEERTRRWQHAAVSAGAALALVLAFFVGRATAIYPLSLGQVIKGANAGENRVLEVRELAPQGIEVINVASSGSAGEHIGVSGTTPDYAALDAYMGGIKAKFGGSFSFIQLDPSAAGQPHHFNVIYEAPRSAP
jgi:transcriptional regulator with XRE-family HTH domain